jgi:hypothetical protein
VFYSRLNEYSLAPQFKWLEYTFKAEIPSDVKKSETLGARWKIATKFKKNFIVRNV